MKNKTAVLIIFITIFIDLLGFGIIIPILPDFLKNQFFISESAIGLTIGIFSLMQFIFTPIWGSLSDVYGRKPILAISLAGNIISYSVMALVFTGVIESFTVLILSRAFAGIFSGNLSAAQSVISDVTVPEERAKGMGLMGAAFSLGFVFGPSMGGFLSYNFGYGVPIILSSVFSLIAFILCITVFKETLPDDVKITNKKNFSGVTFINIKAVHDVLTKKVVGIFVIIFFFITFAYANIHATFLLFAERPAGLNLNQQEVGFLMSFLGVVSAIVQLTLIKYFKKSLGEELSLLIGNIISGIGLFFIPFSVSVPMLLVILAILSFGNGINIPMTLGLISKNAGREEQGSVLGINQSLGSLARFFGPVWGGFVFEKISYHAPFITGAIFMFLITVFSLKILKKNYIRKPQKS